MPCEIVDEYQKIVLRDLYKKFEKFKSTKPKDKQPEMHVAHKYMELRLVFSYPPPITFQKFPNFSISYTYSTVKS